MKLTKIGATSPTLSENLRACFLRAGLSKLRAADIYVLGNPKAWLGTAYHAVLEGVEVVCADNPSPIAAEQLWDETISAQHDRIKEHELDRRFGSPLTWPGYHLTRAFALERAKEIEGKFRQSSASGDGARRDVHIREQRFSAFDGRLVGKPDVVRQNEIVDYKSGEIMEDRQGTGASIKAAYVRQMQIYGYLVKANRNVWPLRGVLMPAAGASAIVDLTPEDCEREAIEAVQLLDDYNAQIDSRALPEKLGTPSPESCKWCSYKSICPSFWDQVSESWAGQLEGAAIEGQLVVAPTIIHSGAAYSLTIDVNAGTQSTTTHTISPINSAIHLRAQNLAKGDRVRITGLYQRTDGVLVPNIWTVLTPLSSVPAIAIE